VSRQWNSLAYCSLFFCCRVAGGVYRICEVYSRAPWDSYAALHDLCFSLLGTNILPGHFIFSGIIFPRILVIFVSSTNNTEDWKTCGNVFVLPRAMIVTIGQISFFGWNSYIPRTLLLWISNRMVGACIRWISILKTKGDLRNFCDK